MMGGVPKTPLPHAESLRATFGVARSILLVLLLVAGLGVVAIWALWAPSGAPDDLDLVGIERDGVPAPAREKPPPDPLPAVRPPTGPAEPVAPPAPVPERPMVRADELPRGDVAVRVLDPGGMPLTAEGLTVRLVPEGARFYAEPLGVRDAATGTWTFRAVPVGWVNVRVLADHVVPGSARANVQAGEVAEVDVYGKPGGAIQYSATYYSGEVPRTLSLSLHAEDGKRPIKAWYRLGMTAPREALRIDAGPKGALVGLPPGNYNLRAESEAGEVDLVPVTIRAGDTQTLDLQLRK